MVNICILGASLGWTPGLVSDLRAIFEEDLEIRLVDINPKAAKMCADWGNMVNKQHGRKDRFIPASNRRKALKDADAVLITLSTGGLEAMEQDLKIPEKYGIYATVGDTTGPSGWSRAVRNIPVFMEFARDFQEICPKAFIANYTNPMASLTATLAHCCSNPVIGLCHTYFETKDVIQKIFGLPNWDKIAMSIAGMNHFTWVVDFKIGRQNGYELLRKKIGKGSLRDFLPEESADEIRIFSGHELCVELYDALGYLTYPADRHTSEFVSFALCGQPGFPERYKLDNKKGDTYDTIRYCNIKRTDIAHRRIWKARDQKRMQDWISGKVKTYAGKSRETGADMIRAYLVNKPFTDSVNTLNIGQIPDLPPGACVETLGVVDGLGVRPLMVNKIPEPLLEIMRPQAICQKWITEGAIKGHKPLLLQALYRDPQCAHLKPHEIRQMADELLEANKKFLPGKIS